jgi:transposase
MAKNKWLEVRLAKYEIAHTPPSLRRGRNCKKDKDNKGKPSQRIVYKGVRRPNAVHDSQLEVTADQCPDFGSELITLFRIESKIIEEIPEPQPVMITEYRMAHYICPCCRK